jgi:hypothetical protein
VSRITRILLLATIPLFAAVPGASAAAPKKLDDNLAALWTTVLETPSAQNPFGTGGSAFACFDLGGMVAPFAPGGVESCTAKPGTKVFIAAQSFECSTFEGNGTTEAELRTCARENDAQVAPTVAARRQGHRGCRGRDSTPEYRPASGQHLRATGRNARPFGRHGWVALVNPLTPGTHTIVIDPGGANITTTVVVKPGS